MTWLSRIAVSTTTRADFGLLRPLLSALEAADEFECQLWVGGTHLREEYGNTVEEIEAAGLPIARRLDYMARVENGATAEQGAQAMSMMGQALAECEVDLLVLLGDRFETLAAATAALCTRTPILHLHGGELTLGAIDDAARHAITKLSHLHGVATDEYQNRVCQLGEAKWRVRTVGALGLAAMQELQDVTDEAIVETLGLRPGEKFVLVAVHPETLGSAPQAQLATAIREGLSGYEGRIVVTGCNADPGHEELRPALDAWVREDERCVFRESLGQRLFFALMRRADALVGNTSSGIIEAPSFGLPTLNLGRRQEGRIRGANVLDVEVQATAIRTALQRAHSSEFRARARAAENPYGDGRAAELVLQFLRDSAKRSRLEVLKKDFVDL